MQKYFKNFLLQHQEEGIKFLEKTEEHNPSYNNKKKITADNRPALQQNMKTAVPFRELREAMMEYTYKSGILNILIKQPETHFVYIAIHDADILHLNFLYDHYFDILKGNEFPDLVSTGYQTSEENHKHNDVICQIKNAIDSPKGDRKKAIKDLYNDYEAVKAALNYKTTINAAVAYLKDNNLTYEFLSKNIALDMQTREALCLSDPRLLYWPEPNMIIKIYDKSNKISQYSFVKKPLIKYFLVNKIHNEQYNDKSFIIWINLHFTDIYESYDYSHESSIILMDMYDKKLQQKQQVRAIFSSKYPVKLKLNKDFMYSTETPQAHYRFFVTAKTAYRQLQLNLGDDYTKFVSIFSKIYNSAKKNFLSILEEDVETINMASFLEDGVQVNVIININPQIDFSKSLKVIQNIQYDIIIEDIEAESNIQIFLLKHKAFNDYYFVFRDLK